MFLLDKIKFVNNFLPPRLRKPKFKAFCAVMVWHVFELWNDLVSNYNLAISSTAVTIQLDAFQTYLRTIYPNVGSFKVHVKTTWDNCPQGYNKFLSEHQIVEYDAFLNETPPSEYDLFLSERNLEFDYKIIVPVTYYASLASIETLVKKYRPAGKSYQILFQNLV